MAVEIESHESRMGCVWCGSDIGCDCEERRSCDHAGNDGHQQCGTRPCGCPRWWPQDRVVPAERPRAGGTAP